jgi:predicted NBD/HSP70 family sugar kinase|tara:strand:+ start:7938 stop:8771 length:834 start_codon:yes stop_codon:yes gene_type:complete
MKEVIAIDLGGTHLRFAYVKNGKIYGYLKKETPKKKSDILKELVNGIKDRMNKNIKGIGIACAGVIENGIVKSSPNLPLKNTNLKKFLQNKFKKNVEIENDANCVAIEEAKLGVKKKNFFILTLGTGIGGGIIINGELYKGKKNAGELGHIIINQGKDFEYFAGTNGIKRLIKKHYKVKLISGDSIKKTLYENTSKSSRIRDEIADYIGQGIASLTQVLDPEVIVLGGGLRKLGKPFLNKIKQKAKKHSSSLMLKVPEIKWCSLEHPGLIGASLLVK